jgi:hypothetical protein
VTEAERAARALERQRAQLLGASATLTLYDQAGASLVVLSLSFFVFRKSDTTLGEEYHVAEIAEVAGMTATMASKVKTARLSTMAGRFTVSVVEEPLTAARTWKLRMTPFVKS